ncbi:SagB/ThcOx family dehydrogenase [Candidatus Poribacteria bacterium]|nr:SagB/ThcOx family dehydrogenase [Candidatus Poribacteria bacterium]
MNKKENIGNRYQEETKYCRNNMSGGGLNFEDMPDPIKTYPDAETIPLPPPMRSAGNFIWDIMARRRSRRDFKDESISMQELSQILWATQGATSRRGQFILRTSPSAGALFPIETYVLINRVDDLEKGVYHYSVPDHSLSLLKKGAFGHKIAQAGLQQDMLNFSAIDLIWTAVIQRSKWKYKERAYRYIYMDAGHIGQNAYLASETLGLGCCTVGAFFDDEVNEIVGVDGKDEFAVYMCCIGKIKR